MSTNVSETRAKSQSLLERVFFAAAMSWLAGEPTKFRVTGSKAEVESFKRALEASRDFINELHDPGATTATVTEALRKKSAAAAEFETLMGVKWLL